MRLIGRLGEHVYTIQMDQLLPNNWRFVRRINMFLRIYGRHGIGRTTCIYFVNKQELFPTLMIIYWIYCLTCVCLCLLILYSWSNYYCYYCITYIFSCAVKEASATFHINEKRKFVTGEIYHSNPLPSLTHSLSQPVWLRCCFAPFPHPPVMPRKSPHRPRLLQSFAYNAI